MSELVERLIKAEEETLVPPGIKTLYAIAADRIEELEYEVKQLHEEEGKEYNRSEDALVRAETAEDRVKELEEKVRVQLDEILSLDADKKELESRELGYIQSLRELEARVRELESAILDYMAANREIDEGSDNFNGEIDALNACWVKMTRIVDPPKAE